MTPALCIDFGTSSIRAVYRQPSGERRVLDIGRTAQMKSLDDASVRSDIAVGQDGDHLLFADHAVKAHGIGKASFHESSPKLWLRDPAKLAEPADRVSGATREELLIGLLAFAVGGIVKAMPPRAQVPLHSVRVAHPIWHHTAESDATKRLLQITGTAFSVTENGWDGKSLRTLRSAIKQFGRSGLAPDSDVVEPIAAAVELLPQLKNSRRICGVVDIGAGTTDIGLFRSVNSDNGSKVPNRLIPLGEATSVFRAGNEIDDLVQSLIHQKAPRASQEDLSAIRAQIRVLKEQLFVTGFIAPLGARIELEELVNHPKMKGMAAEIHSRLHQLLKDQSSAVLEWTHLQHTAPYVTVVMAGGGSGIAFLKEALSTSYQVDGRSVEVRVVEADAPPTERLRLHGASFARLAVAFGGANEAYDTLVHEYQEVKRLGSLGAPKQVIVSSGAAESLSVDSPAFGAPRTIKPMTMHDDPWLRHLTLLKQKADSGDPSAQFNVAKQLTSRDQTNASEAAKWYAMAARQGHTAAQLNLGVLYVQGRGVRLSKADAWAWWAMAARANQPHAAEYLGKLEKRMTEEERRLAANKLVELETSVGAAKK
jgi:hypothetical protein